MDVKRKKKIVTEAYDYLVNTMPIAKIIDSLFFTGVITKYDKLQIREESLESNQVMVLLDSVILRGLNVDMSDQYDGLVNVLMQSDDPVAVKLGEGLKDGSILQQLQPPSSPGFSYTPKNAKDAIKSMYNELLDGIPIDSLKPKLRARKIITSDEQANMEIQPTQADRVDYFLCDVMLRGIEHKLFFEDFLNIMEEYSKITNRLAFKLKAKAGIIQLSLKPEELKVSIGFEKYLKESVKKGSACYRANEPWIYAVCRITVPNDLGTEIEYGSGFVGTLTINKRKATVLVTNNHMLHNLDQARRASYKFGYLDQEGGTYMPNCIQGEDLISDHAVFYTDWEVKKNAIDKYGMCPHLALNYLDYFVVEVNESKLKDEFWSKLDGSTCCIDQCKFDLDKHIRFDKARPDKNAVVSIYHHPQGHPQKKSSQTSKRCGYLLLYLCDTFKGSSGSPVVMTTEHEHRRVIGLHRGFLHFGTVTYNFGSTMSAIVDHIHQKSPEYLTDQKLCRMLNIHLET